MKREIPDMSDANMKANRDALESAGFKPMESKTEYLERIKREGSAGDVALEKDLQVACERYLIDSGFLRMTAGNALELHHHLSYPGWFGHLGNPKGNPFFPDLFVFNRNFTRSLFVELKIINVFEPGQRELIDAGGWLLCKSIQEFKDAVLLWRLDG